MKFYWKIWDFLKLQREPLFRKLEKSKNDKKS